MLYTPVCRHVPRVWGSILNDGAEPVGEIWWVYHDVDGSALLNHTDGTPAGSVGELVSSGRLPGAPFYPILVKTLHTADMLSVQVHPGASHGEFRKEETWAVIDAGSDSWMMAGFSKPVSVSELAEAVESGWLPRLLERRSLSPGDVVHLPPGTVHALGPGLTVLEIQNNCDITYRLFDWDRKGADGKPRRLDPERGIRAIDISPDAGPFWTRETDCKEGVAGPSGYTLRWIPGPVEVDVPPCHVLFLTGGSVRCGSERLESRCCLIADSDGGTIRIDAGSGGWMTGAR